MRIPLNILIVFSSLIMVSFCGNTGRESQSAERGRDATSSTAAGNDRKKPSSNLTDSASGHVNLSSASNSTANLSSNVSSTASNAAKNHSNAQVQHGGSWSKCKHDTCAAGKSLPAADDAFGDDLDGKVTNEEEADGPTAATMKEIDDAYNQLREDLRQSEDMDEPDQETLDRWGFYDLKTMGELDDLRNSAYEQFMGEVQATLPDPKTLPPDDRAAINAKLEAFLQDDHRFQVWSAKIYKTQRLEHLRRKRDLGGLEPVEHASYSEMKNPYYGKRPIS